MTSEYHIGDTVIQHGDYNVGVIKSQGPADPRSALQEMSSALQVLRGQVSAADRQVIDESLDAIGTGGDVEKGTLRRALAGIAGVATMVGQVGVPVVEAVHQVMAAFGM